MFASEYLRGPPEAPYNGRFFVAQHHQEWSDLINKHKQLCINAARDSGKSYFYTLAYPIWQAERHPNRRGFILSGSQPQAERILLDIQNEIENNPNLKHLLPENRDRTMWSTKQMRLANGHEIYARGYGTKVRGAHPVWLVVDDGLNDEDAYSERVREKNINYFYSALRNMVVPGGQTIVIGTPYHQADLYAALSKNKQWHFARYPAIIDYNTKHERAMWPERYPLEALYKRREEIGNIRFAREMLCLPVADDMSLFPSHFFKGEVELHHTKLGMPLEDWKHKGLKAIFVGVDFALSANVGADYTVIWTMGVDEKGTRWIIDIQREHGMSFNEQKQLIVDTAKKYKPALVYLESNQSQRIFGDELIRETDLPVKHFHTTAEKHELEKGIPALRLLFENRKIRIPKADSSAMGPTPVDVWMDEMRNMTFAQGKVMSTGSHDDTVMAFWICNKAIEAANFSFTFGSDATDKAAYEEEERLIVEQMEDDLSDLDEDSFILGAAPRLGRPRKHNAQLVDPLDLEAHAEAQSRKAKDEMKPYVEVKPVDRIPTINELLGYMGTRRS